MNDIKPKDGDLVVGDIHGCFDTFIDVITLSKINLDKNRVWMLGDVIDKGPKQREVLKWKDQYGAVSTTANHEDKHWRWAKGNKVKVTAEMADCRKQLGEESTHYPSWAEYAREFGTWPLYIPFEDSQGPGYMLHAGVGSEEHFDTIDKQPKNYLIRMRTDPFTQYVKGEPLAAPVWQLKYNGRFGTILHGHIPSPCAQVHGNKMVYSLDGGCVYGSTKGWIGSIRAVILGSRQIVEAGYHSEETQHYFALDDQDE